MDLEKFWNSCQRTYTSARREHLTKEENANKTGEGTEGVEEHCELQRSNSTVS